jgi:hypothetical protein
MIAAVCESGPTGMTKVIYDVVCSCKSRYRRIELGVAVFVPMRDRSVQVHQVISQVECFPQLLIEVRGGFAGRDQPSGRVRAMYLYLYLYMDL